MSEYEYEFDIIQNAEFKYYYGHWPPHNCLKYASKLIEKWNMQTPKLYKYTILGV
jgi:hypothetical protein